MANFSKSKHGKDVTKGVDLIAIQYDSSVSHSKKEGEKDKVVAYFPHFALNPMSELSKGETNNYLVNKDTGAKDKDGNARLSHSTMFGAKQFESMVEVAGDNKAPLLNKDGEQIGTIYAVKADLRYLGPDSGYGPDLKAETVFTESELKIDENILTTMYESMREAAKEKQDEKQAETKETKATKPKVAKAKEVEAEVEPELG